MLLQIGLGILSSLPDFLSSILIPCAALVHNIHAGRQVQDVSCHRNSLAKHDIELRFLKRRCNLILHHLDSGTVADILSALLDGFDPTHVQPNRGIKFQGTTTGRCLRISEHDTDLLPQLIDKYHCAIGLADNGGQFTQCL